MNCHEVKPLQGALLDSELDARTIVEIEQHLKSCAECAAAYAEEAREEARMRALLNRGEKTGALWETLERSVLEAGATAGAAQRSAGTARHGNARGVFAALSEQVRSGWRRSRWAWSAMAATWTVIFALNFTGREPQGASAETRALPPASELRLALKQKQQLLAGLAAVAERPPSAAAKPVPHGPRSEWRDQSRKGAYLTPPGARTFLSAATWEQIPRKRSPFAPRSCDSCSGQECPRSDGVVGASLNLYS